MSTILHVIWQFRMYMVATKQHLGGYFCKKEIFPKQTVFNIEKFHYQRVRWKIFYFIRWKYCIRKIKTLSTSYIYTWYCLLLFSFFICLYQGHGCRTSKKPVFNKNLNSIARITIHSCTSNHHRYTHCTKYEAFHWGLLSICDQILLIFCLIIVSESITVWFFWTLVITCLHISKCVCGGHQCIRNIFCGTIVAGYVQIWL